MHILWKFRPRAVEEHARRCDETGPVWRLSRVERETLDRIARGVPWGGAGAWEEVVAIGELAHERVTPKLCHGRAMLLEPVIGGATRVHDQWTACPSGCHNAEDRVVASAAHEEAAGRRHDFKLFDVIAEEGAVRAWVTERCGAEWNQ